MMGYAAMRLPLNRRRRFGGFDPRNLFAAGEQGAWYDPSDLSTMFQDSAGTIPVTAVEQPVGLLLDKSKSGVGTNGTKRVNTVEYSEQFDNAYWAKDNFPVANTTATTDPLGGTTADVCTPTAVGAFHRIYKSGTAQVTATSCTYSLSVKANGYTKIGIRESATSGAGAAFDLSGTGSVIGAFNAGGSTVSGMSITPTGNNWFRIVLTISFASATAQTLGVHALSPSYTAGSTISESWLPNGTDGYYIWGADLRLASEASTLPTYQRITADWPSTMAGNHASQSTAGSQPVLSARVNLLTQTEDFSVAAWAVLSGGTGSAPTRTANYAASPIGTQTATRVQFSKGAGTTSSDYCLIYQSTTSTSAATRTIWIKSNSGSTQNLILYDNQNASAGTLQIAATTSWQKFTLSNSVAEGACLFVLGLRGGAGYGGDNSVDVLLWGADLRVTNVGVGLPAYQRVAAATDYDTNGFPLYLKFDGTDDGLATASIDFTATNKMSVFAGVRKLSDASIQCFYELSALVGGNNGTFVSLPAYDGAVGFGPYWYVGSKGTVLGNALTASTFAAPQTVVHTQLSDISGDLNTLRLNSTQVAQSTTDQGTGNFGNYPLYIGRRGGTTLPYNGNLYSLIVRGALSTDAQIASTETYVNNLTKAY